MHKDFFPELTAQNSLPRMPLIRGVIFEVEGAIAYRTKPLEALMEEGARNAEDFMRAKGMQLPNDFWTNIVEARLFAYEKSEEEREEHIANDAMSFLLQFFGYPASELDPEALGQIVDVFYAPEMTAWQLYPHALEVLSALREEGYRTGIVANTSCDRVMQRTVDYLGARPYLDLCITSASVEYRKPDTAIFDLVLQQWDALPYELVIAGPSYKHDVASAIELGAQAVLTRIDPEIPANKRQELDAIATPDATVYRLSDLPRIVNEWASA